MEILFYSTINIGNNIPQNIKYLIFYHPNRAIIQNVWILFTKFTKKKNNNNKYVCKISVFKRSNKNNS